MNPLLIAQILPKIISEGRKLIDEVFTTDDERNQAKLELSNLESSINQGQIDINKQDSKSKSMWQAGWRPGFGWLCVAAFFYHYLIYPILLWLWIIFTPGVQPPPDIDTGPLMALALSLLGFGGFRTVEYLRGVIKK